MAELVDSYVKLLLPFDGVDGAGSTIDLSGNNHVFTFVSTTQLDTAIKKFGLSAILFDGNSDYIHNENADFAMGTGDFTIDYWVYHTLFRNYITHCSTQRGGTGFNCGTQAAQDLVFYIAPSEVLRSTGHEFVVDTWQHVAITRSGTDLRGFVDGILVDSATNNADLSNGDLTIGCRERVDEWLDGSIDEFRISKGIARWTANFTPPPYAYQTIAKSQVF